MIKKTARVLWNIFKSKLFSGFYLGLLALFFLFQTIEFTSTDQFCESCHVHPHVTVSWKKSTHFNNKDFILELDYKCSKKETNSDVFLRVPEMPAGNDYIYHSFEIQIDDRSQGIHHTGAAYDAEAPKVNAEKKTGEWNHFKISFMGKNIKVELNGKLVKK